MCQCRVISRPQRLSNQITSLQGISQIASSIAMKGYTQLLSIIGRVRSKIAAPGSTLDEASVTALIRVLNRFRQCCQYGAPPKDEKAVQDVLWIMLRASFDRVDREDVLQKFGAKGYKSDFGLPDLRTIVEAKFIGEKTDVGRLQDEILADVQPYLQAGSPYAGIVVIVYDAAQKLRDDRKFREDLRSVNGVVDVIVVPGVG